MRNPLLALPILVAGAALCYGQLTGPASWSVQAGSDYRVVPNITYLVANGYEAKLDVYSRKDTETLRPTLVYIHGGGWVGGTKESSVLALLPWMEMGWNVVNVEYRLARISLAPAAVEDCLCALRWVAANAKQHGFDTNRIVVSGGSAGGHLALTTGMIPESAGLDRECPGVPLPKVAAIVNWYGITDVNDLLDGANRKTYAVAWLSSMPDREAIAKRVSPLTYVRAGLPPILTIHGDADPTVPYSHATRLQQALEEVGVKHRLFTVPGGKHGGFTAEEMQKIHAAIREFLTEIGLPVHT